MLNISSKNEKEKSAFVSSLLHRIIRIEVFQIINAVCWYIK